MSLRQVLKGYPIVTASEEAATLRVSPANLVGAAGRVRLLIADTARRAADVQAVYDPATNTALIHVSLQAPEPD